MKYAPFLTLAICLSSLVGHADPYMERARLTIKCDLTTLETTSQTLACYLPDGSILKVENYDGGDRNVSIMSPDLGKEE